MTQAAVDETAPSGAEMEFETPLFRHAKRPAWGAAILVGEDDHTRAYQFEDGQLRKFNEDYYGLIEPADDLGDRAAHIAENLRRVVGVTDDGDQPKVVDAVCPFSAQVALFKQLYPEGFEDPKWVVDHRRPDGSALKRHRTPISREAQEKLSAERCAEAIESDSHEQLVDTIAGILSRTDMVPVSHAKSLRGLESEEKRRYAESVVDLLHGDGPYERRLRDHLKTHRDIFDERPNWRVATTLPALMYPQEHTPVRRSAFLRQAGSIAPTARYTRRARVGSYKNFQRVAVGVRKRLNALGHEPRDLLDVYDFVWTTLRSSALEHLKGES